MNKRPTHLMEWWQVDGPEGTMHFPVESFSIGEAAEAYEFPQAIDTIKRIVGHGVHDGSLWEVFPTREDAEAYIAECAD